MKCQHCGSNDMVAIQGQNYCLSCGNATGTATAAVTASADAPSAGADEETLVPTTPVRSRAAAPQDIRPAGRPRQRAAVHPLRFSLLAAVAAAAVSGLVTAAVLWFQLDSDSGAYVVGATLVALGIGVGLAHAALLYGRSRNQDGRPAPREYWWLAARGGFMEVVNVQLIGIICGLVVAGVGAVLWHAIALGGLHLGTLVTAIVLGIINLALVWALLGVYAAARLATPAVVIGGYGAGAATRVGWQLYRKAGGHLMAAALEAVLSRAVAGVVLAMAGYAAAKAVTVSGTGAVALGGGIGALLIVFVAVMLFLEVDTKLWLGQYRHWVGLCPPAERIRLLTGRVQSHL